MPGDFAGGDLLLTIAEVALAFAGFSSIVAVFQHRSQESWTLLQAGRLRQMLVFSLLTMLLAFLPFGLAHWGLAPPLLWSAGDDSVEPWSGSSSDTTSRIDAKSGTRT